MIVRKLIILCLLMLAIQGQAQVVQNFNQSVNQIGQCWQKYNMEITTKNTINRSNQKKALVGSSPLGSPAYFFMSPIMQFNGTGVLNFSHKLTAYNGQSRSMRLVLLDQAERPVQVLHQYEYIANGVAVNGNPTTVVTANIPITWTGTYILKWEFTGTGDGSSVAMVDDIYIDGIDMSDGTNDNGFGYCRADDVVYDTVCAGSTVLHKVPFPIQESDWNWDMMTAEGALDTTVVNGPKDTVMAFSWDLNASGDYELEATELRYPYMTTSYSVRFYIHVKPAPSVEMTLYNVCADDTSRACFDFNGTPPYDLTFTDGDQTFNYTVNDVGGCIDLPHYLNSQTITVTSLTDATGCSAPPVTLPSEQLLIYSIPITGDIFHW